ncbi:hypothetical protein [Pseudotenacibaculum haliotis]|uniref:Uncharacterized protein n=1 Tax=Pseudotenacibaculum haliotis TaxID=1862138 RepID=A0ABW5LSN4_9FLAO
MTKKKDSDNSKSTSSYNPYRGYFTHNVDTLSKNQILLEDIEQQIGNQFVTDSWIPIYSRTFINNELCSMLGKVIPIDKEDALKHSQWIRYYEGGKSIYDNLDLLQSNDDLATVQYLEESTQLVIEKENRSTDEDDYSFFLDVSKELIDFLQLTEKEEHECRTFYAQNEKGELNEVLIIKSAEVKIKVNALARYLFEKKLQLVLCFYISRKSVKPGNWNVLPFEKTIKTEHYYYRIRHSESLHRRFGYFCGSDICGKIVFNYWKYDRSLYQK